MAQVCQNWCTICILIEPSFANAISLHLSSRRHKGNLFHGSEIKPRAIMGLLIKHIAREPPSTIIDRLALMCEV